MATHRLLQDETCPYIHLENLMVSLVAPDIYYKFLANGKWKTESKLWNEHRLLLEVQIRSLQSQLSDQYGSINELHADKTASSKHWWKLKSFNASTSISSVKDVRLLRRPMGNQMEHELKTTKVTEHEIGTMKTPQNSPYAIMMTSLDEQGTIATQPSQPSLAQFVSINLEEYWTKAGKLVIKDEAWSAMTHVCYICIDKVISRCLCMFSTQICVNVFVRPYNDADKHCIVYFKRGYTVEMLLDLLKSSKTLNIGEDVELELYKADEDGKLVVNEPSLLASQRASDQGFINYHLMTTPMHFDAD